MVAERCADMVQWAIDYQSAGDVAAFIAEPVQGRGGIRLPPQGFLRAVARRARAAGALFVLDEILTVALRVFARDGFAVDRRYARIAGLRETFLQTGINTRHFLDAGLAPAPGFVLRQPELAVTLERLARMGTTGLNIATRILGLLLAAIAIQTMAEGLRTLFPGLAD